MNNAKRTLVLLTLAAALVGCRDSRTTDGVDVPGSQSAALVRSTPFTELVVEVDYVQGHEPSTAALDLLQQRLEERCNKPGGVHLVVDDALPLEAGAVWSLAAVRRVESRYRDRVNEGQRATLYVVYLNGQSSWDSEWERIMGWAYSGSSIAMFPEGFAFMSNNLVSPDELETSTLIHEAGHLLGLVNMGTPMQHNHEDFRHLGHDRNPDCVMYHAVETMDIRGIQANGGAPPTQFDEACIQDLRAIGGR